MRQTPCGNTLKEKSNLLKTKDKLSLYKGTINKMGNNKIVINMMLLKMKQMPKSKENKKK